MSDVQYFTKEGLVKVREEIDFLKNVERIRISAAIAEARDKGDLSENAEYDAAKEQQGLMEDRLNQLEHIFANARLIDTSNRDMTKVMILSKVRIMNHHMGKESIFTLVSESEANFAEGKISVKSAIGSALVGKVVGDEVEVVVPVGKIKIEVLEILA